MGDFEEVHSPVKEEIFIVLCGGCELRNKQKV